MSKFVRVLPPGKATGGKVERVCIGGQLFIYGSWYEVPDTKAAILADLQQAPGIPFFQVVDQEDYSRVVKQELVAAARAAGFDGMADLVRHEHGAPITHKAHGKVASRFAGMDASVKEVQPGARIGKAAPAAQLTADAADDGDDDDAGAGALLAGGDAPPTADAGDEAALAAAELPTRGKLSVMSKASLLQLAAAHDVNVPVGANAAQIKSAIIAELGL